MKYPGKESCAGKKISLFFSELPRALKLSSKPPRPNIQALALDSYDHLLEFFYFMFVYGKLGQHASTREKNVIWYTYSCKSILKEGWDAPSPTPPGSATVSWLRECINKFVSENDILLIINLNHTTSWKKWKSKQYNSAYIWQTNPLC